MCNNRKFCLFIIQLFAISAALCGRDIFVSPDGSDRNPGSSSKPLATITAAAKRAAAGDTVKIAPGIYREQIVFRKSGKPGSPITFSGTRGKNGEFLTIIEAPGKIISHWLPAPEIAPGVWKAELPVRPDLVMMDGKMIAQINARTMTLPRWKQLPPEIDEAMLWSKFGKDCRRLPGFDLLSLPPEIRVKHQYFGKRKERFWEVLNGVLAGWSRGYIYLRFTDTDMPQKHTITASNGEGFILQNASHLVFKNLQMRGSRRAFRIRGKSSHNTIDRCFLKNGSSRVRIDAGADHTTVKNSILTAGFIRSDLFQLRSAEDMRGGLLYLIFKYIIGVASSDDIGIHDNGSHTIISGNFIMQGLIGINAAGRQCEVKDNVVREMSSVGICTFAPVSGIFHGNLVMNCGIPLRIHDLRGARTRREEFHYRNLFIQAKHAGQQIYVHCESHRWGPDMVNFEKGTNCYLENPPAPVDPGKIWIYHNTFWGGNDFSPGFTVLYLAKRFRERMPFFFINNTVKWANRMESRSQPIFDGNLLYTLAAEARRGKLADPDIPRRNRAVGFEESKKLWNKNDLPGLPDVTLAVDSPAKNCGIDISRSFSVNGETFSALPGFAPGYFKAASPDAGALQYGENMQKFIRMHRQADEFLKMFKK